MSLPLPWIDKIFSKLTLVYGRDFIGRWEGLELADVKTDWAHELAGLENHPDGIAFALQNMPAGRPPNVLEFKAMTLKAPRPATKQIDPPKADPAKVAEELRKAVAAVKKPTRNYIDQKAWAKTIIARDAAGEKVRPIALRFARDALRMHLASSEVGNA
jgi:hypothetical protein